MLSAPRDRSILQAFDVRWWTAALRYARMHLKHLAQWRDLWVNKKKEKEEEKGRMVGMKGKTKDGAVKRYDL
jgi:hypothetical protein